MPFDPQGNYSPPTGTTATDGQAALASQHNLFVQDASSSFSKLLQADGRKSWTGSQNANGRRVTGAGDAVDQQDYVTLAQLQAAIAGIAGVPVGIQVPYTLSGTTAPSGWLFANGQEVLRADHPTLWAGVQAGDNLAATQGAKTNGQYGPGNGATTFTLPNLYADNGYFIRPVSSGRGIGTVQADAFKSHDHAASVTDPGHLHNVPNVRVASSGPGLAGGGNFIQTQTVQTNSATTGISVDIASRGDSETRPKNIAYPVLIKAG